MWKRTGLLTVILVIGLPSVTAAAENVVATKASESNPAASITHVAWEVVTRQGSNVHAKPLGGTRFRVNPSGVFGAMGGIDGTMLVYQEYVRDPQPASDLTFYDLATGTYSDPPPAVNTPNWEHSPDLSGDKLLLGRELSNEDQLIVLFDLVTEQSTTLARVSPGNRFIHAGQVNGNFVTWSRVVWRGDRLRACDVFLYDIAAGTNTRVPNASEKCQYAPSVDPSGTVYFARSGFACGANAVIMKYPAGGTVQRVEPVNDGQDLLNTYAVDNGDGTTTVYLDPGRCNRTGDVPNQDIESVNVSPSV